MPEKNKAFRWLHFSDIHVGQDGQDRVWPRASTLLLDDLETAHRKTGGFDCLVFSGDLVQKGAAEEFEEFDEVLTKILNRLGELGERPPVITIPGNHDLSRPDRLNPVAMALTRFWSEVGLREAIWKPGSEYLSFLESVFFNYSEWRARAIRNGVHLAPAMQGLLPGDGSYFLDTAAGKVGVIGLNSTWLQLGGGDYLGQLHVDARQLLAVTENAPDDWVRANELNLLITHQPASWLHADSPASWDSDLNPAGRFDLHLFGHMHEPDIISIAHGGGVGRRNVQAASLFGLEKYGDGHTRIQGYSANRITLDSTGHTFTCWPRKLVPVAGGRMKLVPDSSQEIDEDTGALSIAYNVDRRVSVGSKDVPSRVDADGVGPRLVSTRFELAAIHHPISESKGHLKVRRVEQDACVAALLERRLAWVASDWGMGSDGFIAAICARLELSREKVFSLDFNGYDATDTFFDGLRTRLGGTFQQMCDALAEGGRCVLLLDDINVGLSGTIEQALDRLVGPVCDFAAEAYILLRSRRRPKGIDVPVVELKPLDEADVAIYARESELGGERFAKPDAVSKLFRHTDGVPSRLDDALRDLEIVSLSDLLSANPDYGDAAATPTTAPSALVATVDELARSNERADERAYKLLLALSGLPQGEQLARLTRFLGPHPFYPSHARSLVERSLVGTIPITALEGMPGDDTQKALIVPRTVREYIRSIIDEETAKSFDRKALDLYFGDKWALGEISSSPTGKRVSKALCDGYEISNSAALILRSMRRSLIEKNEFESNGLIRLASAFIETLIEGDHFRTAASLSEDAIRLLEEFGEFSKEVNFLRYHLACSLRMIGRTIEARTQFELLDLSVLSKSQRQSAELELALTLKRLKDNPGAADAARRVIILNRKSSAALQARVIIAQQIENNAERTAELQRLLTLAKKGEHIVTTNNIRLILAKEEDDHEKASMLLKEVVLTRAESNDFYNGVRAALDLAERQSRTAKLEEAERLRLIDAYHFLYSERMINLFDRCHEALWNEFERSGQIENLLNLFRHSSFIWRLNGHESTEARYLSKLVRKVQDVIASEKIRGSRDGAYFVVRMSVVMKDFGDTATDR